jgi:transposase-like protein/IS1 family transposase
MTNSNSNSTRPPIETLACVNVECKHYGQRGHDNLLIRKVYGTDHIRYLRCRSCGSEFSERKGSALWNTKVSEEQAESVAAHLAEGCSFAATTRLVKVDRSVVIRLNRRLGKHGQVFHDTQVKELELSALQGDERHGYAQGKGHACWEAEVIDPVSKFVVSHVQGRRDEALIRALMSDAADRLHNRHHLLLLTDGEASYAALFPELFGQPYQPARHGSRGRLPNVRYRIPRTLAHVQIVKQRVGSRVVAVDIRHAHGSKKFAHQVLTQLDYREFNTSAVERRNGTARRMSAYQVRRSLAFAHRSETKLALGWWGLSVYNWCRTHRSLRQALVQPRGKKSFPRALPPWLSD